MNLRLFLFALALTSFSGGALVWEGWREESAVLRRIESEKKSLSRVFTREKTELLDRRADSSSVSLEGSRNWVPELGFKAARVPNDDSRLARLLREKRSIEKDTGPLSLERKSWEGYPATVLFDTLPSGEFLLVEKTHAPVAGEGSFGFMTKFGVLIAGFVGLCLFGVAFLTRQRKMDLPASFESEEASLQTELEPKAKTPLPRLEQEPALSTASDTAPSEFVRFIEGRLNPEASHFRSKNRLRTEQEREWLREFGISEEKRSRKDPSELESRLVLTTAKATQAPALFFRFDASQGIFRLSAQSGLPAVFRPEEPGLSFSLSRDIMAEARRVDRASKGEPSLKRELSDQASISKLLRKRFRIVGFDAWPMFSTTGEWVGVLVVSHSKMDQGLSPQFFASITSRFESRFPSGSSGVFR